MPPWRRKDLMKPLKLVKCKNKIRQKYIYVGNKEVIVHKGLGIVWFQKILNTLIS